MPFTTAESRRITDATGPQTVGDRCFLAYREMLRLWRHSQRWTTAHEIYRDLVIGASLGKPCQDDDTLAGQLAWQVFFAFHVLPYEEQMRIENGEVNTIMPRQETV